MLYLLLAILCSSSIALIFKYSEANNKNRYAVTSANYLTASLVGLFMSIKGHLFTGLRGSLKPFTHELINVIINNRGTFSDNSGAMWALLSGIITGVFFFASFIYYQKCIRDNSVALTGSFSKMGILVPVIISILLWNEHPTPIQWIGISLCITAILIANLSFENGSGFKPSLIALFLLNGFAEFSSKFFQKYAYINYKDLYLFFVFTTSLSISLFFMLKSKKEICLGDILTGICVGIPNLFSSYFLILALYTIKASVAFPLFSAGSIVLINIGGILIFKEKLKRRETISIILTIIALILIN